MFTDHSARHHALLPLQRCMIPLDTLKRHLKRLDTHLRASIRTGSTRQRKCGGMPPKFPCARALGWAGSAGLVFTSRKISEHENVCPFICLLLVAWNCVTNSVGDLPSIMTDKQLVTSVERLYKSMPHARCRRTRRRLQVTLAGESIVCATHYHFAAGSIPASIQILVLWTVPVHA